MREDLRDHSGRLPGRAKVPVARFMALFMLAMLCTAPTAGAQDQRIDLKLENATLGMALRQVRAATGLEFFYNTGEIDAVKKQITANFANATVTAILGNILDGTPLTYRIDEGTIVIVRRTQQAESAATENVILDGTVLDGATGQPLAGVTVLIESTGRGTATDSRGRYSLAVRREETAIVFSYIGYQKQTVRFNGNNKADFARIMLVPAQHEIEDVVVTGIYERKKESFTGSAQTYSTEELKMVGTQNLLQSLRTLDPSFVVMEDNQYGSDPNRTPDIEIRGKSSIVGFKEQFGEDPNQPLFILDGFETTLQTIMDLSLDRIANVTLLKDAASTAIYGAKAANGVVVVETKVPAQGKLRVSYNGSMDLSWADLTQYNLMDAAEKLEFELLSGNFNSNIPGIEEQNMERYNNLLHNVKRGVDTYWMSEPLRMGVTHRHNVYLQGGDNQMRYGLSVNYTGTQGVMKKSKRDVVSGALDLLYRKGKISFSNKLTVDFNLTEDPVVEFSQYSRANPYYPKYNEAGGVDKWLETSDMYLNGGIDVPNPLWNDALNSYNKGNTFGVRESLNVEYRPFSVLVVRARAGLNKTSAEKENFRSPEDTSFDQVEKLKKGSYSNNRSDSFSYDGELTVTYGQLLADAHQINAVVGTSIRESTGKSKSFSAVGFPEGDFTTPAYANKYPDSGKPGYSDSAKRTANFYLNTSYSYKNRYLMDFNLRADGSSVFGSNRRFTTTWAVGLAWNLHREAFIADNTDLFSMFKIRASVGNPGNQNFGSYNTLTTYKFNNWLTNNFGTGLLVDGFGDPNLDWQKTMDRNIGLDLSMFDNRFHLTFDYYYKSTDPLMAIITIPLSIGTSTRLTNVGKQVDQGCSGTLRYAIIYRPQERVNWTFSVNFRHSTAYYDKIGETLRRYNTQNRTNSSLTRYFDGGSPTALWSVVSLGIDPATGREIFRRAEDGKMRFDYSTADEVVVGDTRPKIEGVIGNTLYYKGFSLNVSIRYSLGADAFNNTLYTKVENISSAALTQNQDRRALHDRWQKPGDKARFKGISFTETVPISSRFVQKNEYISVESVRVGYEFEHRWMEAVGFSGMTLSAYMNDILRIGSIKSERGIDYPFARSVSLALSVNF